MGNNVLSCGCSFTCRTGSGLAPHRGEGTGEMHKRAGVHVCQVHAEPAARDSSAAYQHVPALQ